MKSNSKRLKNEIQTMKPSLTTVQSIKSEPSKQKTGVKARRLSKSTGNTYVDLAQIEEVLSKLDTEKNQLHIDLAEHRLEFSNLNKVLWPGDSHEDQVTKRDYLRYLCKISPLLLKHLHNRPLTMIRYPDGVLGKKFFQKHWSYKLPPFLQTLTYFSEQNGKDEDFLLCNNFESLLWFGQIAALELHTPHTRFDQDPEGDSLSLEVTGTLEAVESSILNYPDYLILDLDPYIYSGKEASGDEPELNKKGFRAACSVATTLKDILADMGLDNVLIKTSGKTGLHLYIPLIRNCNNDELRTLAGVVGKHLVSVLPDEVTVDWAVKKRTGKIFFDHNMNARGKTLPAPYSTRNSLTATVSTPLDWDELESIYPTDFTINTVPARVEKLGDIWGESINLKKDLRRLLKPSK